MNTTNLMKDPFYVSILAAIETQIHACDRVGRDGGIELNDSQIRSILNKVRKSAEGGSPQIPNVSARDQVLANLHRDLVQLRTELLVENQTGEEKVLPTREWILALRCVEDSIRLRSTGSGSRAYLDFLAPFLAGKI